ncbi:MAG: PQQ-binding-like beta-propeller repeat protein [Bacteroidales bacterium]
MTTQKNEHTRGCAAPMRHVLKRWLLYGQLAVFLMFNLSAFSQKAVTNSWEQFRGANGAGVISGAELPENWALSKPALLWTLDVGNGFSEVAVKGDVAYIQSSDTLDGGYEFLAALNADTGEELWKTRIDSLWVENDGWGHGPRSTPAIGEEMVYCLSGCGRFCALKPGSGEIAWSKSLVTDYGARTPRWGFSTSPVIAEDMVIIETGGTEQRAVTAFDAITGEIRWSKGNGAASYCTPAIVELEGQQQLVYALDTMLIAFDPQGNEIWSYRMPLRAPITMPVFIAPDKFFLASEGANSGFIVQVKDNEATEVYSGRTMLTNWSTACYHEGYLYGFSRAKLVCMSVETGKMTWGERGFGKGSLMILNGKLVIMADQGELVLAEANPEAFTPLYREQVLEGRSWTAPSFANGKLFVRNHSKMSCYSLTNNKML